MLTAKDFSELGPIGVLYADHKLSCYKQGDEAQVLFKIDVNDLLSIDLEKSDKKDFNMKQLLGWWMGWNRDQPIHAAAVYRLMFTLSNEQIKYTYLSNIDIISVQKSLKKLRNKLNNAT